MSARANEGGTFGYLALLQLLGSAAVDERLTNSQRRVLTLMATYAGPEGKCCIALRRIYERLGVTRQAVQKAARELEKAGYLTSERRHRPSGAEGGKVYAFNLDLAGADACPVGKGKAVEHDQLANVAGRQLVAGRSGREAQGGQTPEVAPPGNLQSLPPCNLWRLPIRNQYKKPISKKPAQPAGGSSPPGRGQTVRRQYRGTTAGQQGESGRRASMPMPINGGCDNKLAGEALIERVEAHNLDRQRDVAGRMTRDWLALDPEGRLLDALGVGGQKVWEKAREFEVEHRMSGLRYIARAIERATQGAWQADAILAGDYSRALARAAR